MFRFCLRGITWLGICLIVFAASSSGHVFADVLPSPALPPLVISEVQTGGLSNGTEDGRMEFVELYNPGDEAVDVTDWAVDYLAASSNGSGAPTRVLASLEGQVAPGGHVLLSYQGYLPQADAFFGIGSTSTSGLLARSGGHVRLVDADDTVVDLVGWGTGVAIGSWWHATEIPAGSSIQRVLPGDPAFTSGLSFGPPSAAPTPQSGGLLPVTAPVQPSCSGIALSEMLPNPTGADGGQEFVEIYNQTDTEQSLKGCSLRLGTDGKAFALPNEMLAPHAYRAFSDTETGITLPNATAQTVWLLAPDAEQGVAYPDNVADDQAWALIDDTWQTTLAPTPNLPNVLLAPPTADDVSDQGEVLGTTYADCPAGKERNPATNRCRTIPTETDPATACDANQVYNPLTHRCRLAVEAGTSTSPKPCASNQERNPDTGRCHLIVAATTEPKPCPAGQERNAQTNRCRKISSGSANGSLTKVQDVQAKPLIHDTRVWMAVVAVAGLAAYGVYEWRQEILRMVACLRAGRRGG